MPMQPSAILVLSMTPFCDSTAAWSCRFLARSFRQECTSAAAPEIVHLGDGSLRRASCLVARPPRGAWDDDVAAHRGQGALRRWPHRARQYRVVGERPGVALRTRVH